MNILSTAPGTTNKMVIACLGESLTKGEISYNWVSALQSRPQNHGICFVNLGVGGDHSYNALQRVPQVTQCHPDKVVVLIGAGDIACTMSTARDRVFRIWKRIPQKHSIEQCARNIHSIVTRLKNEAKTKIALCSLPLIGENPESEINVRVKECSGLIKKITGEENIYYVPFYEQMYEQIAASPGRAFDSNFLLDFISQCRAAPKILVYHKGLDEVGKQDGWQSHVDGLHLNSRSGKILENLVQEFLDSTSQIV